MAVYVCGDMHGNLYDTRKITTKEWDVQKQLTQSDVLIQLGDFGWIWYEFGENDEQEYYLDYLAGRNYTLAVVPGNHENYNIINSLPIEKKWGGQVRVLKRDIRKSLSQNREVGHIYFLMRGEIYNIDGHSFWVMGGAMSIDKDYRIENESWWPQEMPDDCELQNGITKLKANNWKVDFVLTHDCPTEVAKNILFRSPIDNKLARYFDNISEELDFLEWHFGHYHQDRRVLIEKCNPERTQIYQTHYRNRPLRIC